MRKHVYLLLVMVAILVAATACNKKPTAVSSYAEVAGLIDEATGQVLTNTIIVTNTVYVTNQIPVYYTNEKSVESITTNGNQYVIKYETNEVVPNLPAEPGSTYRIYVPYARDSVLNASGNYFDVDYRDKAKLSQLWLDQVNRKAFNDGRVFAIRNGANNRGIDSFQKPHTDSGETIQDYYYFASNGDIYYKGDGQLVKKFAGAIIVDYVNTTKKHYGPEMSVTHEYAHTGKYTVGAIYKMAIDGNYAETKYWKNGTPAKKKVYTFINANVTLCNYWNGFVGRVTYFNRQFHTDFLEVLVMNPDANEGNAYCMGVDSYYFWWEGHQRNDERIKRMTDANYYLGQRPEYVIPLFNRYAKFTDSWDSPWWSFLFMPGAKN